MEIRDGQWRLVGRDVRRGRTTWATELDDGRTVFRTDYDVTQTIDDNAAFRNMLQPGWAGDWHRVASIPANVYYDQLAEAERQGDDSYVRRWLNDSDRRAWRTKDGRL